MQKIFLLILSAFFAVASLLLTPSQASAKSRIAFLQTYDRNGNPIQYEPGSQFTHSAIQFDDIGDQWLNAYPGEGVAIISWEQLQRHGKVTEIVEIPQDVYMEQVTPLLGKPFDFWYSWSDEAIYCSELIGKLLSIPTHPMKFNRAVWPKNYWHLEGTSGLSPDQLWKWAHQQTN